MFRDAKKKKTHIAVKPNQTPLPPYEYSSKNTKIRLFSIELQQRKKKNRLPIMRKYNRFPLIIIQGKSKKKKTSAQ